MHLLDMYNSVREELLDFFGCVADCRNAAISDERGMYWILDEDEGEILFASSEELLGVEHYVSSLWYVNRVVSRNGKYVAVAVDDANATGEAILKIFSADNERSWETFERNMD